MRREKEFRRLLLSRHRHEAIAARKGQREQRTGGRAIESGKLGKRGQTGQSPGAMGARRTEARRAGGLAWALQGECHGAHRKRACCGDVLLCRWAAPAIPLAHAADRGPLWPGCATHTLTIAIVRETAAMPSHRPPAGTCRTPARPAGHQPGTVCHLLPFIQTMLSLPTCVICAALEKRSQPAWEQPTQAMFNFTRQPKTPRSAPGPPCASPHHHANPGTRLQPLARDGRWTRDCRPPTGVNGWPGRTRPCEIAHCFHFPSC